MKFRIELSATVEAPEDDREQIYQAFLEAFEKHTPADFDMGFKYRRIGPSVHDILRDVLSSEEIQDLNESQT